MNKMKKYMVGVIGAGFLALSPMVQAATITLDEAQLDSITFLSGSTNLTGTNEGISALPGVDLVAFFDDSGSSTSGLFCDGTTDCNATWQIDLGSDLVVGAGDIFGLTFENKNGTTWELGYNLLDSANILIGTASADVDATDPNTSVDLYASGALNIRYVQIFVNDVFGETLTNDSSPDFNVRSVPEPSIIALFGLGLVGMGFISRRRKS